MTSKGIAQRLIAKHGPATANAKVQDKLRQLAITRTYSHPTRTRAAKLAAHQMLWAAVRHHLNQH